jgi:hypothetical protein
MEQSPPLAASSSSAIQEITCNIWYSICINMFTTGCHETHQSTLSPPTLFLPYLSKNCVMHVEPKLKVVEGKTYQNAVVLIQFRGKKFVLEVQMDQFH